jgi:O-antigen biosynthesis protein
LTDNRHHVNLERGALRALETGDIRSAFALSDRRCRIRPLPDSQIYLLRAEALHRLGSRTAALEDVAKALEINPDDIAATRRMMSWGTDKRRLDAAVAVAAHDTETDILRNALNIMQENGRETCARIEPLDSEITGWVTWKAPGRVELILTSQNETREIIVPPDPAHRLATGDSYAADFRAARSRSAEPQTFQITHRGRTIATAQIPGNEAAATAAPVKPSRVPRTSTQQALPLTVIVPVYADFSATTACLESLLAAAAVTTDLKILIVNDASPDEDINRYLRSIANRTAVTLLSNPYNLGFVGAINRALRATPEGDVILLNADTLVPPAALQRLRKIVTSTPGIGTATPLSNNGEFTSFPAANRSNPLPLLAKVTELDLLASKAAGNTVVDIPNGIGFCLYITRACRDAVGELSESFHRGYLEDVDLCLRANEAGFRNVCVPSVYVGHEGSRSFRQEKRSLVVRNLQVLKVRYPGYEVECAAFALADPLRRHRDALERKILATRPASAMQVVLTGHGAVRDVAEVRSTQLAAKNYNCLIVDFRSDGARRLARVTDLGGDVPQSIEFEVTGQTGRGTLQRFLTELAPQAFEIAEPKKVPREIMSFIKSQRVSYRILIADGSLALDPAKQLGVQPCWQALVDGAEGIIAADLGAEQFATTILGLKVEAAGRSLPAPTTRPRIEGAKNCLGILMVRTSAGEFRFLHDLSRGLAVANPDARIVVLGQTLDDQKIMQLSNVFVTGRIDHGDIDILIQGHGIGKLLIGIDEPLFGHPLITEADATGLPIARFEWTGSAKPAKNNLHIDPSLPAVHSIETIRRWLLAN